ncbi:fluoride efflux transporter CrcB [Sphingomonas sp. GCM10030256]|uniref:fluoride efflux transporter CrcB n=1 Tax=Sphingomonas sp. GCM10030256 TaxID=3273427 RepID=UPI003609FE4A
MHYLLVFVGGGLGAALRHGVNRLCMWLGTGFPAGTLTVNVLGSLLMGLLISLLAEGPPASQGLRLFLATGLLGGFTTFSAFSLDALTLWERGQPALAALYVAGSVLLSLAAIAAGFWSARLLP